QESQEEQEQWCCTERRNSGSALSASRIMSGGDLRELAKIFGHFEYQDDGALCEGATATHCHYRQHSAGNLEVISMSGAKSEVRQTDVRVLYARFGGRLPLCELARKDYSRTLTHSTRTSTCFD